MIDVVKTNIEELKGKNATIKYNLGRNKYEKYEGIIKEAYNYIFLVEINGTTKSFSLHPNFFSPSTKICCFSLKP